MMKLTKNDMARVIVQALYNLNALPAEDNDAVAKVARRPKDALSGQYQLAHKILTDRIRLKVWAG